jgi:Na+-transporting NADH:ubiquinone oxidoreductase subunit F
MAFDIAFGVATFATLVMVLVALILAARAKLVASGSVQIDINDDPAKRIEAAPGNKLLGVLASEGIFLSSACGGGGTCGLCKCQVMEGGGHALPTEEAKLTRQEIREGWRLSCQVAVKQDMKVHVPEEFFGIAKLECTVLSNDNVATFIKELVLKLPENVEMDFRAGGYVQIAVPQFHVRFADFDIPAMYREDWEKFGLFDLELDNREPEVVRAYSMANYPEERGLLKFNIRIASPPPGGKAVPPGIASTFTFSRKPGDKVTVFGPFGEFYARETGNEMVFIGGGAGMAPLRAHIFDQLRRLKSQAQDQLLVRRALAARGLLRRGVRHAGARERQLRVAPGAVRPTARGQVDRRQGLHPPGGAGAVPEEAPRARGLRVLPVRPAADAGRDHEDAARLGRGAREHPLR